MGQGDSHSLEHTDNHYRPHLAEEHTHTHMNRNLAGNQVTYASILNPDMGNKLNFIPAEMVNGSACAKLIPEDVSEEIDY